MVYATVRPPTPLLTGELGWLWAWLLRETACRIGVLRHNEAPCSDPSDGPTAQPRAGSALNQILPQAASSRKHRDLAESIERTRRRCKMHPPEAHHGALCCCQI
ncbi:hypothetical protein ACHAQJ_006431 [Trichoderma viride]